MTEKKELVLSAVTIEKVRSARLDIRAAQLFASRLFRMDSSSVGAEATLLRARAATVYDQAISNGGENSLRVTKPFSSYRRLNALAVVAEELQGQV